MIVVAVWVASKKGGGDMKENFESMPMREICVGRFMIEVPAAAVVTFRNATISGWDIYSWEEKDSDFDSRENDRLLSLGKQTNSRGQKMLELNRELVNGELRGRILVFNRRWLEGYDGGEKNETQVVAMEANLRVRDVTYSIKSDLVSDADIIVLERIIGQLVWRDEKEVPVQKGFCINRGMVEDPLHADQAEYTGIFLGLEDYPDVAIAFTTMAGIEPGKTLLQRDAENDVKREFRSRFHVLREGLRNLNGITGEEILERVNEPNGSTLHGFVWESLGKKDDVFRPSLVLELVTGRGKPGNPVDSSLSDKEALVLWEKISSSLRARPTAIISQNSYITRRKQ